MSDETWIVYLNWRAWTFGIAFGPEVYELHLGPLVIGYAP